MGNVLLTTKVITPIPIRLSYLHVWEPAAMKGSTEQKYSANIIIPKKEKALIKSFKEAIEAATIAGKETKFQGKVPPNLKTPLRDGDIDRPEDENYAGCYFVNATSKTQPGIVDKHGKKILDQDEVYSGCYGIASLTFFAFNAGGSKGISCGLNHIMKIKDGEPLGGRSSAESDFADVIIKDDDDEDTDDDLLG